MMKAQKIFTKNAQYQKFEVLKSNRNKRYRYREFFVEGVRNINEAVNNGWMINSFIYSFERELSRWASDLINNVKTQVNYELPDDLMSDLSGKSDTSELLAIMQMREDNTNQLKLSENPVIVLFDRPSNKGNLGTIIRSCDALGADGLIITGHAVDLYDPETITATMGSFFKVPAIRIPDHGSVVNFIMELKNKYPALNVVGTSSHAEKQIYDFNLDAPVLLMIGNETEGLSFYLENICDITLTIPMAKNSSASSFNVACAASIILYEISRQRASPKQDI